MDIVALQRDPEQFQRDIVVPTGSGPKRFGDVLERFQIERFSAVNPLLLAVARHEAPSVPRVWDERTKGGSKDTDWTVNLLWLLGFSRRPLRMQVGAFDQQQADEVRLIVRDILRTDGPINAFLNQVVQVRADSILNDHTGSVIEILTADEYGSHGSRIDLLLMNELTHQPSSGFAETLFDNLDKMPNALGVVATNSGHDPSWQLDWKRIFQASDRWLMLEYDRPAPWVSASTLAEAEKRNPPGRFQRLWHGCWTPTEGNPALSPADVNAAFDSNLQPMRGDEQGFHFVAGCDLGLVRDCASVVTLGIPDSEQQSPFSKIRLAAAKVWTPVPNKKISLLDVEQYVLDLDERFNLEFVVADPWQSEHLLQRLEIDSNHARRNDQRRYSAEPWCQSIPPSGSNLRDIASLVIESFQDGRFDMYSCPELKADLLKLRVVDKSYGFRLESPRDETGHGDTFSAFSLALFIGHRELASRRPITIGALTFDSGETPFQRAMQAVQRHNRELQFEDKLFSEVDEHSEQFRQVMRLCGRV